MPFSTQGFEQQRPLSALIMRQNYWTNGCVILASAMSPDAWIIKNGPPPAYMVPASSLWDLRPIIALVGDQSTFPRCPVCH